MTAKIIGEILGHINRLIWNKGIGSHCSLLTISVIVTLVLLHIFLKGTCLEEVDKENFNVNRVTFQRPQN